MSDTLKNFMLENFDFDGLLEAGFFTEEMRNDYQAQADRVCKFFGYETVYEYGAVEIRGHVSYAPGERPLYISEDGKLIEEPMIFEKKNIYL